MNLGFLAALFALGVSLVFGGIFIYLWFSNMRRGLAIASLFFYTVGCGAILLLIFAASNA